MPFGILQWLANFTVHETARKALENGFNKTVDTVINRSKELIATNPREAVIGVLRRLEEYAPEAAVNIWEDQRDALTSGQENIFFLALGNLLPRDVEKRVQMDEALERFAWFGSLSKGMRVQVVEGLTHDPIAQFIRYWVLGRLEFVDGALTRHAEELQPLANRLRAEAREKGIPAWLRYFRS